MDFSTHSVAELRKMLIESGKYTEEETSDIKGKSKLVEAVLGLNSNENNEESDDIFEEILKTVEKRPMFETNIEQNKIKEEDIPDYNSVKWHNFVMSQFAEDEKDGEYPTLYGLRRVAELILGPIIQSGPTYIAPPTSEASPGRSTCVYTIVFDWNGSGIERSFSATGGAYEGNTDEIYSIYPECIAESRSEARALRKALKLKVMAAEEAPKSKRSNFQQSEKTTISTGEWKEEDNISTPQKILITQKCKEMKIDLDKFIEKEFQNNLEKLNKGQGKFLIELINKYQTKTNDSLDIPDDIKLN